MNTLPGGSSPLCTFVPRSKWHHWTLVQRSRFRDRPRWLSFLSLQDYDRGASIIILQGKKGEPSWSIPKSRPLHQSPMVPFTSRYKGTQGGGASWQRVHENQKGNRSTLQDKGYTCEQKSTELRGDSPDADGNNL